MMNFRKKSTPKKSKIIKSGKKCITQSGKKSRKHIKQSIKKRIIYFHDKQLQEKFKHASDFGIQESWSLQNLTKFQIAIENHVQSSTTKVRWGTFRRMPVVHYFDPQTALNVFSDDKGYFISGWKLKENQLKAIRDTGNIGGG
jgi:hypothetical protein